MIYEAKIIKINPEIKNEVIINIDGLEIIAFLNISNCKVEEQKYYTVKLDFVNMDNFNVELCKERTKTINRIGKTMMYEVSGYFINYGMIESNIIIQSDLLFDYNHFIGKNIKIKTDRINIDIM